MKQFLLALCGIPASGKTTLAEAIIDLLEENVELVSTDLWRDEEYYANFTPEREGEVRRTALERVTECIQKGQSVMHDDTNYYASMRHELYEIARNSECVFGVVYVTTPLDKALEWNRAREQRIPEVVVRRIRDRLDVPGHKYAWDRAIATVNLQIHSIKDAAKTVVERLETLRVSACREHAPKSKSPHDLLDTVTRQVVHAFLSQYPEYQTDARVSRIRRELLNEAVAKDKAPDETEQALRRRLESLVRES